MYISRRLKDVKVLEQYRVILFKAGFLKEISRILENTCYRSEIERNTREQELTIELVQMRKASQRTKDSVIPNIITFS